MDILSGLNEQQKMAVTAGTGPVLVLAGPGSGKTNVLTRRILYVTKNLGVPGHQVLAVTFTNKAAREMQKRAEDLLDGPLPGLWLGTFHSICARILRREADYLPVESNFVIFDADDQLTLVKRALKELNLDEKLFRPAGVHAAISTAKNELIFPQNYPSKNHRDDVVGRIYQRYQQLLQSNNALDFDDLLMWSWRIMEQYPEVREKYASRFAYILVDEFQDTNLAQYELLRHLASLHQNIFVVGDEDQSIYRWRGADYRNVMRFEEDYPRAQKILLEQNYRSTQSVLDAASAVINHNLNRTIKRLRSLPELGQGERLTLYEAADDHAEAAYVVDTIQSLVRSQRASAGEFAVMYRTNAQSRLIEEAFLRAGMPYRLVGAQRFYGRREIKDLISYLRLVQNPADEISLARAINIPPRGIGDKTLIALQLAAQQAETSPGRVLLDLGRQGKQSPFWDVLAPRGHLLADFGAHFASWCDFEANQQSLPALFDQILEDIGYQEYLDDGTEEGRGRWENVQELRTLAYEYEERGLTAFLETLALVSDQDTVPETTEAPTLLTLHAAKGLEFSVVFITGLDDGILPHNRSLDEPEEMAEERRLFYVGLTRAKHKLYLVRAEQRSLYGSYQDSQPSRFLDDLPAELVAQDSRRARASGRFGGRRNSSTTWDESNRERNRTTEGQYSREPRAYQPPPPAASAPISEPRFRAGMRVRHSQWNSGLVIESRVQDGDEIVTVAFDDVGLKRLMASLANLEIVPSNK